MGIPDVGPAITAGSNLISEVKAVKSGWKTTEFWVAIVGNLITVVSVAQGVLPAKYAVVAGSVLNGLYFVSRGLAKS